jgi:flagellar biogenesis protein FliO
MIQKFISSAILAGICLLSPMRIQAIDETIGNPQPSLSEEKFKKLQKEMESDYRPKSVQEKQNSTVARTSPDRNAPEVRSLPSLAFQILMGIIFVLFLAVITIRVLKRLQGRMLSRPGKVGGEFFEVLETCHLGTHQKVVALRMNDEVGILGVTPQGISLISVLKEPASEVRQSYARENNSVAFSENLNKLLDRFKKPKKVSDMLDEVQG